jgi:hypothetical protein
MKDRAYVRSIFLAHAASMRVSSIAPTGMPYQFTCSLNWQPQKACLLVNSSDYWMNRMHLQEHTLTMFVVWSHDSCLPYKVLCLRDGKEYMPYTSAKDTTKRTKSTSKAFLGQLLCGVQMAFDQLAGMPYQSRRRYELLLERYAHRERGRPLKIN